MNIKLEGIDKALKELTKNITLTPEQQKKVTYPAAQFIHGEIEAKAKTLGDGKTTTENDKYGSIADDKNTQLRWNKDTLQSEIYMGDSYWWFFLEYGLKAKNYEPKPFFEPTYFQNETKIRELLLAELQKELNK